MADGRASPRDRAVTATDRDLGVSSFNRLCVMGVEDACEQHVRRWARDRALPTRAVDRLCLLTWAALRHGLRYGPSAVSVNLRWADLDHVRVDVRWYGGTGAARSSLSSVQLSSTLALFDAVAESWGFECGSPRLQWMVVDTRSSPPPSATSGLDGSEVTPPLANLATDRRGEYGSTPGGLSVPAREQARVVLGRDRTRGEGPSWERDLDRFTGAEQGYLPDTWGRGQ